MQWKSLFKLHGTSKVPTQPLSSEQFAKHRTSTDFLYCLVLFGSVEFMGIGWNWIIGITHRPIVIDFP